MSPSFESSPKQERPLPRPTPEGAGAMAKRAAMLAESYQGNIPDRRGLCVLADSDVATILQKYYPQIDSIDTNVAILGGHLQEKVRQALEAQDRANEGWVIIATKTGVYVYEVATNTFLPNNATLWHPDNLKHGADYLETLSKGYSGNTHLKTPPIDPPSDPTLQ